MSNDPPVLKLAQPGYDVHTAGDENLIYSSKWPMLKIAKSGSYQTSEIGTFNKIADHDLGFIPVFWYFANTAIGNWQNFLSAVDTRSEFMGPIGDGSIEVDADSLQYQANQFPGVTGPSRLYYYIFALDITKQYDAPIIRQGDIQGARGSRVFKIAKPGKDVSSDDLFDFTVHSRARSPLLHSVNPSGGAVKNFVVQHNLGYVPIFFAYQKTARGTYKPLYTGQGGSSNLESNENTITFNDSGGQEITIVVLKDPFNITYSVAVTV